MNILAVSDIHGSDWGVRQIYSWIDELAPDLLIVGGDITHFGPVAFARDFLEGLSIQTLAIPGNCDPASILDLLDELEVNLHGRKRRIENETFVGFGASNPTPFDTLFEIPDQDFFDSIHPLMQDDVILVTHAPPYGVLDTAGGVEHVGSRSVMRIIEEFRPKLSVFGHIHEARGIQRGETTFVNSGSARRGQGAIIDVNDSIVATSLG